MTREPTRKNIIMLLEKLLNNEITRDELSTWAQKYYLDDTYMNSDDMVNKFLSILGGVNLAGYDREYLYMEVDFKEWIRELKQ